MLVLCQKAAVDGLVGFELALEKLELPVGRVLSLLNEISQHLLALFRLVKQPLDADDRLVRNSADDLLALVDQCEDEPVVFGHGLALFVYLADHFALEALVAGRF